MITLNPVLSGVCYRVRNLKQVLSFLDEIYLERPLA